MKKNYYVISFVSCVFFLVLDAFSKALAVSLDFRPFVFIKDFFYLTAYQKNDGIAFGIDMPMFVQIVGSFFILIFLFYFAEENIFTQKKHVFLKSVLFGIIIGGAVGNMINRIMQGYVVDFIVLKPLPVFNIADIGITAGLIGLLVTVLISHKNKKS